SSLEAEVNLPFITQGKDGPLHLVVKMTRAKLETIVLDLIQRSIEPVKKCLTDAKLKVADINEIVMVGGMTRMPKVVEVVKDFFGKEPNASVNPDEVVAIGAAVQAGVLSGEVKDVVLLDVTPLTLSVETLGGVSTPMITRNTTVPTSKAEIYSTAADNQTSVEINVLQGERPMATDNKSLGRFVLSGIPPAPRGVPQVEVTFDIDANGILSVAAKDKASGKVSSIKITGSTGLSKEEVEKMRAEAEAHAAEDTEKKDKIEAHNKADNMIYLAEKTLKDAGDKAKPEDKTAIEEKVKGLKEILETGSKEDLETKTSELSDLVQKVSASMYQNPPSGGAEGAPADTAAAEENGKKKPDDKGKAEEGEVVS
ncbi:MAG: Hsp70 family protein, partial [Patescibacteria group bacterium]